MENYIVSARKYRPATFDTVVGQSHITTTLKNALKTNQLAQAFLFCGPRGVGKTTCARILAKTINCLSPTADFEACATCDSCLTFKKNGSLNIFELDAASNNSVDDIRNLVDQVRFPPQTGKRKVYIIDEVHMLSTSAFNAFLKTLEEPPAYVIFILATTERHKIIPTILSRCQIFDFKRIEVKDIALHLEGIAKKEKIKVEYDALELIAQKADGGLRDALSLFDMLSSFSGNEGITYQTALDNLHILDYDYYFRVTDALLNENLSEALNIFDEILRKGFDGHQFVAGLGKHLRDLMVCKDAATVKLLEVSERAKTKYAAQSQKAPMSFLLSALNMATQTDLNYKNSKLPRNLVELALMKMAHIQAVVNWDKEAINEKKKINPENNYAQEKKQDKTVQQVKENGSQAYNANKTLKLPTLIEIQEETQNHKVVKSTYREIDRLQLINTIDLFKKTLKDNLKAQKALGCKTDVLEDHIILFQFENEEQLHLLEGFKERLLKFLKDKLQNPNLELKTEIIEIIKEKKPYTNPQKYDYLAEKNPVLKELKERLGLEVEH